MSDFWPRDELKPVLNLTGLTIEIPGNERLRLEGDFNAVSLADRMIYEWVPYFECHKCGRFDYCKFVQRFPNDPERARDIKCGVVESVLRLFVKSTFPLLAELRTEQRQAYLDAAFHFETFLFNAETLIGAHMSEDYIEDKGDWASGYYGRGIVRLRDNLNRIAEKLREIPQFRSQRAILFVEGWSEKAFLEKLRESGAHPFIDLLIDVYDGRGNRKPKRIQMLLDRFKRLGYSIFIEGDADGNNHDIFRDIVAQGTVNKERTFVFQHDFETSIPLGLLLAALQQLGELVDESLDTFRTKAVGEGSVGARLKKAYGIELEPLKMELASQIADILNQRPSWWQDERFLETELGRFLKFVLLVF
jgi:hypothetical protein